MNKNYNGSMLTYAGLQGNRRKFSALTGLTLAEFRLLLTAFARAYERLYPPDRTAAGRPRRRSAGGGAPRGPSSPRAEAVVSPRLSQDLSPAGHHGGTLRSEPTGRELVDPPAVARLTSGPR